MDRNISNINKGGKKVVEEQKRKKSWITGKQNKKAVSLAHQKWREDKAKGLDHPELVASVNRFEKKHRRMAHIDEIINMYAQLQIDECPDELQEPHSSFSNINLTPFVDYIPHKNWRRKYHRRNCIDNGQYYYNAHGHIIFGTKWSISDIYDGTLQIRDELMARAKLFYTPHSSEERCKEKDPFWVTRDSEPSPPIKVESEDPDKPSWFKGYHFDDSSLGKHPGEILNYLDETLQSLTNVVESLKVWSNGKHDVYIRLFEDLVSVFTLIQQKSSVISITVLVINIIKGYAGTSASSQVALVIKNLFSTKDMNPQDDYAYLNKIRDFTTFAKSQFFTQFKRIIVALVSFGLINPIDIKYNSIKLFQAGAENIGESAIDVIDYVLDVATYFIKTGHMFFRGDYSFLSVVDEIDKVDDNIIHLKAQIDNVIAGGYTRQTGKTVSEYQHMLYSTYEDVRVMSRRCTNSVMKRTLLTKMEDLSRVMIKFINNNPTEGLRKAPFSMAIYGQSAVGKSTVADILMKSVLKSNGFSANDSQICTLQPNDKFYSNYKMDTVGVLIDDVSNTIAAKAQVNPADMIISLVNNVKYSAPKSESKEKGAFNVEPHVVIATTNVKDLGAAQWSNEPLSVIRRMRNYITVTVKDQFATAGKLDSNKIDIRNNTMWRQHGIMDVWDFKVEYVSPIPRKDTGPEQYVFRTCTMLDGTIMEKVDIFQLQHFLNTSSATFYEEQTALVEGSKESAEKMEFCKGCKYQSISCKCKPLAYVEPNLVSEANLTDMFAGGLEPVDKDETYIENLKRMKTFGEGPQEFVVQKGAFGRHFRERTESYFSFMKKTPAVEPEMEQHDDVVIIKGDSFKSLATNWVRNRIVQSIFWQFQPKLPVYICLLFNTMSPHYRLEYLYYHMVTLFTLLPRSMEEHAIYCNMFSNLSTETACAIQNVLFVWSIILYLINLIFFTGFRGILSYLLVILFLHVVIMGNRILYYLMLRDTTKVSIRTYICEDKTTFYKQPLFHVGVTLLGVAAILKLVKNLRKLTISVPQGNLCPQTQEDYIKRDTELNPWKTVVVPHELNKSTATMMPEDLLNRVSKNFFHIKVMDGNNIRKVACIGLNSNIVMCPYHFFHKGSNIKRPMVDGTDLDGKKIDKVIVGRMIRKSGNSFVVTISIDDIVQIADQDLCIFKVPNIGSLNDIREYVTDEWTYSGPALGGFLDHEGNIEKFSATCVKKKVSYSPDMGLTKINLQGGDSFLSINTAKGMCSAPIISVGTHPSIIGFHIAGFTGKQNGAYNTVTRTQINKAIETLNTQTGTLCPNSSCEFRTERFHVDTGYETKISSSSPVHWIDDPAYIVRGNIDRQYSYWSEIRRTVMCNHFEELTGTTCEYAGPQFGPVTHRPYSTFLEHAAVPGKCVDSNLLLRAKNDYIKPLKKKFVESFLKHNVVKPLTTHQVVNGIDGVRYVDSLNANASFGFPKGKKKKAYMEGEPGNKVFINQDEIDEELLIMKQQYLADVRYYPIFKACLKDEPQKKDKFKVRVFHAADMPLQFAMRKYFLPLTRFFHMHPIETECAVGINPQSTEWQQMHDYITFAGTCENRILAGDYSKWDIRLPADVVLMAFKIIIELAELCPGFDEEDLSIMKGLATDVTYYNCHFNGTLIEFVSGVPSGHNLTALINSISNSLLLRCGFFHAGNKGNFRDTCHFSTYGDDFWGGVLPGIKLFNHLTYRDFLKLHDIILTMPIKDAAPTEFLNVWVCDFLKRRSVRCPYDNVIYGALDVNSINKSIMVKGKTSTSNKRHAFDVLTGAMRELSFHDLETYTYWSGIYRTIANRLNLLVPGYVCDHADYFKYRNEGYLSDRAFKSSIHTGSCLTPGYQSTQEASVSNEYFNLSDVSSLDEADSYELELLFEPNELTENYEEQSYHSAKICEGCNYLYNYTMEPHSNVIGNEPSIQDATPLQSGILHLSGAKEEAVIDTPLVSSDLLSLRQDDSRSLKNYLSRPLLVFEATVAPNTTPLYNPRILYNFLTSSRIRDKIRNYAYINGVLNVKVTSVGSPQVAGAMHVALHPWWARDNSLRNLSHTNVTELTHCQMSQLPSFLIDFGAETGGHIKMPIIAPTNGLNISEIDQIEDAFMLYMRMIVPLQVPVAQTKIKPSVQVYVWMDDVELTGTTLISELPAPQSDEFSKDPNEVGGSNISFKEGIAAAAGSAVGRATELGVSSLMSGLGFSQPLVPEGAMPMVPRMATNMSCYNTQQNIESLASDIKNEVSIGTKELGYDDDDHMALSNIYRRWGILGTLTFDLASGPGSNNDINVIPVSPLASQAYAAGSDRVYSPPPVAVTTLPFNKWRGGMEYKFVAVGSAFLKGKIKISHDVNTRLLLDAAVRDPQDVQALNTVIWDWSQYRTMTIQVPWTSNLAFKDTGLLRLPFQTQGFTTPLDFDSTNNGVLIIEQFTNCSDQEYETASVVVYVRAMEGMAYGDIRASLTQYTFSGINTGQVPGVPEPQSDAPTDPPPGIALDESGTYYIAVHTKESVAWFLLYLQYINSLFQEEMMGPQSDFKSMKADVTTFGGQASQSEMVVNIAGIENNLTDHDKMAEACMGEKFFHLRQINKRYTHNWTRNVSVGSAGGQFMHRFKIPDRPFLKGWQGPNSLNVGPDGKPVTYARDSFLSFFSVCFMGYRGSYRHKVMITTNDGTARSNTSWIARTTPGPFYTKIDYNTTNFNASASSILSAPDMRAGGTVLSTTINPVAEYSTPFQCRAKFAWAQDRTPYTPKFTYDGGYDIPWHGISVIVPETTSKWFRIDKFIAAGDDFSLFFWLYAPLMMDRNPAIITPQ